MMHTPPTAMYAIPRKLLRPPMTVRVVRRMALVPLYSSIGKSATLSATALRSSWDMALTIFQNHLIPPVLHGVGVVSLVQLAERGKPGGAHPNLERLPVLQVRGRMLLRVVVGVELGPV